MKKIVLTAVVMAAISGVFKASAQTEFYSASRWIWGAAEAHSHENYSLRAAFNVPGPVRRASIKVYVDDGALYWMNGTSFSYNEIVDGNGVQEGRNVLAMLATNHVSKAGVILRGDIELTDGSHVIVNSNAETFKVTDGIASGNWQDPGFDDSSWRAATEIGDAWTNIAGDITPYVNNCTTEEERAAKAAAEAGGSGETAGTPNAKIVYTNGVPKISLNGTLVEPVFNQSGVDSSYCKQAVTKMANLGITINQLNLRPSEYEKAAGSYDFSLLGSKAASLLQAAPDARILVLIRMELPKWLADNEKECIGYANGPIVSSGDERTDRLARPSPASSAYCAEAKRLLTQLATYIKAQSWGDRVIGVRPCWGIYTEWHMYGMDQGPDKGIRMTEAFRKWKNGKYANITQDEMPSMEERKNSSDPFFLKRTSNETEQKVIDFYECQATVIADLMTNLAHTVKTELPGRLVGMYYGYVMTSHSPEGANVMLDRVLSSPDVDFMSNPADYSAASRLAGGAYYHRTIPSTFHRYGKLVMLEDDMRHYHISNYVQLQYICTRNAQEAAMTTRRNWLNRYFDGCGLQMLDPEHEIEKRPFSMDEVNILQAIADTQRVLGEIGERPADSGNEVAVVVDWRERLRRSTQLTHAHELVYTHALPGLYASGVPFDMMSLDDFLAKPASRYRKAIFLNVVAPEGEMKTALQQRVSALDFKSVWLVQCPFSLSSTQAKVRKIDNLPSYLSQPTVWRDLLTWMEATPMASIGHCIRRHGDVFMFHTAGTNGTQTITLPSNVTKVKELYTGKVYEAPTLTIETDGPGTWVFKAIADESWKVGDSVTATLGTDGILSFTGTGSTRDFSGAADVPWDKSSVKGVRIGDGVTLGENVFAGLSDTLPVSLSLGGLKSGFGASVPDGMLLVSRTEVEAAGAATLEVANGKAVLGITVCTNSDLTAKVSTWKPVSFEKSGLTVSADGTKILAPIPANAEKGFMILRSGN
ncbi:MAG: hypothetical protein IKQ17_06115 [Kiritimatiellae bacterium]|nr:hypothetical protein [Kiritimatiellia bacterium]